MTIDRKTFISNIALGGAGVLMGQSGEDVQDQPAFAIPDDFSITYLATRWGFPGTLDEFCASSREAGYDGIEVWLPNNQKGQEELFNVIDKYDLEVGLLVGSGIGTFQEHFVDFKKDLDRAVQLNPLFINCHSGKDFFPFEQNRQIIDHTVQVSDSTGIGIYHETHRSRILFAAHIARQFIDQLPGLRLTMDISHWCNVHESLLGNQPETVQLALERTDHIHSRIGHPEGPQVTDPRAPEWKQTVEAHFAWWDRIVKQKIDEKKSLTMTPEFGPPTYMPAVPYTGQPLGNQWEINKHMMYLWKQRYS